MPLSGSTNFNCVVQFKCACRKELSAGFYEKGNDVRYIECPFCKAVHVVAKPFLASLEGLAEEANDVLHPFPDEVLHPCREP